VPAIYNVITNNPAYPQNHEFVAAPNCDFEDFSLRVYSRWGRLVYSTSDATKLWNGTRGQTDPAGTYFYQLTYTTGGVKTEKKGYVELVK
jgi:gliding motility-associated-like protein